jgi:cyclic-di-GMP-binding biofilm dispersal mediator protein
MSELSGAVILVVGATGGLGSRIAEQLTAAGATVVSSGRISADPGAVLADLRDRAAAASVVSAAIKRHGRLDGLVIAAGVVAFGPIAELKDDTIRELFDLNVMAPIQLVRSAVPYLAESAEAGREPFVVTLSGIVAEAPTAGLAAYSASKAGLNAFTQAATRELRKQGIRLVDARPGHTETRLSTHPIAGTAPLFPAGLDPDAVAARIVRAIVDGERDLPSTAFTE